MNKKELCDSAIRKYLKERNISAISGFAGVFGLLEFVLIALKKTGHATEVLQCLLNENKQAVIMLKDLMMLQNDLSDIEDSFISSQTNYDQESP